MAIIIADITLIALLLTAIPWTVSKKRNSSGLTFTDVAIGVYGKWHIGRRHGGGLILGGDGSGRRVANMPLQRGGTDGERIRPMAMAGALKDLHYTLMAFRNSTRV